MPAIDPNPSETRAPDGGPYYVETPTDLTAVPGIAEPFNAVTASLFVWIVVVWAIRLRGRYGQFPFLMGTLVLLLIGGVGGTLYHGLRSWVGYFLMDVIPIYLLGLVVAVYLWVRLGPRPIHLIGLIGGLAVLQAMGHGTLPRAWAINLSYAALAVLILVPLGLALVRTRFRDIGWVATALVSFGIAWFCRIADIQRPPLLPMGTHWLWHTFGAITTAALSEYLFRLEGLNLRLRPHSVAGPTLP